MFARIWTTWHGTRGTTVSPVEGEHQLFGFLTTDPNDVVAPIHPRAMPVTLMTPAEIETWTTAPAEEALRLRRPLPDGQLAIVARGERKDERQLSWPSVNCAQRLLFIRTLQTVRRCSLSSSANLALSSTTSGPRGDAPAWENAQCIANMACTTHRRRRILINWGLVGIARECL